MVVFAANVTEETKDLIASLLATDKFVRFALQTRLNLSDNTILLRLSFMALENAIPSNEYIARNKAALLRPHEFDDFLRAKLKAVKNTI